MNSRATLPSTAQTTGTRPVSSIVKLARVPNSGTEKIANRTIRPVTACSCMVVSSFAHFRRRNFGLYFSVIGHLDLPHRRLVWLLVEGRQAHLGARFRNVLGAERSHCESTEVRAQV